MLLPDSSGLYKITLQLSDIPEAIDIMPATSVGQILVDVLPMPDPPSILMFSPDGNYMLSPDPTTPVIVSNVL